jgi:Skp family chaperone for outer membrane proteins
MKLKKVNVGILSVLLLSICGSAWAERGDIAVVDLQRILKESQIGMTAKRDLEAAIKGKREALEKMQNEIKQGRSAVQKQASILSQAVMIKKIEELKAKEKDLQQQVAAYQQEFSTKNNAEILKVITQVKEVLVEASEGQFSTVIDKDGRLLVYSDPKVDFTDKVIELLDENN